MSQPEPVYIRRWSRGGCLLTMAAFTGLIIAIIIGVQYLIYRSDVAEQERVAEYAGTWTTLSRSGERLEVYITPTGDAEVTSTSNLLGTRGYSSMGKLTLVKEEDGVERLCIPLETATSNMSGRVSFALYMTRENGELILDETQRDDASEVVLDWPNGTRFKRQ